MVRRFDIRFRNYVPFDEELKKHRKGRIGIPPIAQEINEKLEAIAQLEPDMVILFTSIGNNFIPHSIICFSFFV